MEHIDINNLPEGWRVEEGRKTNKATGKKRIFILDLNGECVGASCGKCGDVLVASAFEKTTSAKFKLRSECKICRRKSNAEYKKNNKEKVNKCNKEWRTKNKEKVNKIYKESNKKRYKSNPEYFLNRNKVYRKNNPEKHRMLEHKRRARKKASGGSYTTEQLNHCLNFFNGCCAYTGEQLGAYDLDHVKPLSKGGTSFIYNLVPATPTANRSKGAKDLEDWYKQQPYYSEERLMKIYEWQKLAFELYGESEETA